MEKVENINDKFSHKILVKFFSNLPIDDVVTVQRVCHNWRAAAQDRCLWDNYTLTLTGKPENEKKIKIMPALRNINGHTENHMVNVILENTTKLNKMNCIFNPPLSASQVQSVVEKYPQLESITLNLNAADVLESVEMLKTSKYLKELLFVKKKVFDRIRQEYCPSESLILKIANMFSDVQNFPSLIKLDLTELIFRNSELKNIVADIIMKRAHQLLSLKLRIGTSDNSEILCSVGACTTLENLYLDVTVDHFTSFNLDKMSELRSLYLCLWLQNNSCVTVVCDYFNNGTWKHLTKVWFDIKVTDEFKGGILSAIIQNVKQLRLLRYNDMGNCTSKLELKHIGSLTKLENVNIGGLRCVSKDGITFLMCCHNLRELHIYSESSDIKSLQTDLAQLMQSMKKLQYFSIFSDKSSVTLKTVEEIEGFIAKNIPHKNI